MRPQVGSLVAAVGGLVFVLVNAGALPAPLPWPIRGLGSLAFAAVVWFAPGATC